MQIRVWPTVDTAPKDGYAEQAVVVIDVLRATSTIVTALAAGVRRVWPVATPEQAVALAESLGRERTILGGERESLKIAGFDLGNSPLEYRGNPALVGRDLVLTTTNGTRALGLTRGAGGGFALSLLNVKATAMALAGRWTVVHFVCAGTRGRFSLEDTLAAGLTIAALKAISLALDLDDLALATLAVAEVYGADPLRALRQTPHGRHLAELSFGEDLVYCAAVDALPVVAQVDPHGGFIVRETSRRDGWR